MFRYFFISILFGLAGLIPAQTVEYLRPRTVILSVNAPTTATTIIYQLRAGDGATTRTSAVQSHTGAAATYRLIATRLAIAPGPVPVRVYLDRTPGGALFIGTFTLPDPLDALKESMPGVDFPWTDITTTATQGMSAPQKTAFNLAVRTFGMLVGNQVKQARKAAYQRQLTTDDNSEVPTN